MCLGGGSSARDLPKIKNKTKIEKPVASDKCIRRLLDLLTLKLASWILNPQDLETVEY